jgi:hypothetical protein
VTRQRWAPIDVPLSNNWSAIFREALLFSHMRSQSVTIRQAKPNARSEMIRDSMPDTISRITPDGIEPLLVDEGQKVAESAFACSICH